MATYHAIDMVKGAKGDHLAQVGESAFPFGGGHGDDVIFVDGKSRRVI